MGGGQELPKEVGGQDLPLGEGGGAGTSLGREGGGQELPLGEGGGAVTWHGGTVTFCPGVAFAVVR